MPLMDKEEAIATYVNQEMPPRYKARITPDELKFFRTTIHPTRRNESVRATRRLIEYLNEKDLVTSAELQEALDMVEMTVLKRLNALIQFHFIQRKLNRYYVVTPRLRELARLYIDRL